MTAMTEGLVSIQDWRYKKQRERDEQADEDARATSLTVEEQSKYEILKYCADLYEQGRKARKPYETFDMAWDLYLGNVWPNRWPAWRPKITINKIQAIIHFMQAMMTDNKPRFSVDALLPGSEDAADLLRKKLDAHWDSSDMQSKVSLFSLFGLVWGTGVMKTFYDPYANGGQGQHVDCPIPPYQIYVNPGATCVEDAEWILHVHKKSLGWVRRNFPDKAAAAYNLRGITSIDAKDPQRRDFVREGDSQEVQRIVTAQNVDGNITGPQISHPNPHYGERDQEECEIVESWFRDDTYEEFQRQAIENGKPKTEPITGKDGIYEMETVGYKSAISEIDGQPFMAAIKQPKQKPVMESAWRLKYPGGRLCMSIAGRLLLRDIPNPFQIDGFPFSTWKDKDVGSFWGHGETIAQKDCQIALNKVVSQIYNILEKVGNPIFKGQKGMGFNAQSIKDKPGNIIMMDDLKALEALEKPQMPREFIELYGLLDKAMPGLAGINDASMGKMSGENQSYAMIDSLQESGSSPVRLKVRNYETGLRRIGKLRLQLIQQFDKGQMPLREKVEREPGTVEPASEVETKFRFYKNADLQGSVEFNIVPISSLSTSPAAIWAKWMDLYQKHIIDRRWFIDKFQLEGWRTELPRLEKQEALEAKQQADAKQQGKPGPAASKTPSAARRKRPANNNITQPAMGGRPQ